ncbi:MAG: heat-inducible transcription repressor HrcA [Tenericutes bacterium]|nr:heat-inducible transcriptional repressor HrcA [Bacilli bacterium]MDD3995194.1 heat-inducible transcriptional repressor HrcA [Bacilli bacterium]MDD4624159.1 heat-inducible transcriptional repressor HrcA [Bacilli bacterium]MDD4831582.1 heat-inducible transcriptional repressor HrcA [Bacilli bacterium]NLV89859.1 heat-inducible transcription repressor HrcA [Mycoplasmatota bacterium]
MITNRQKELLKKIVEEYIKTVKPVGSKSLCDELDCSSATIRNDMADLEDLGYLEKTHTSSGRIPSEKGYRYYVDELMKPKEMTGEEVLKLQTIFKNNKLILTDAITKSMEIISDMTSYTSIVLGKSSADNKLKKIEVIPISEFSLVAIIITDKGHVENKSINIGKNLSVEEIKKMVDLINSLLIGTPIDEVSEKLEFEIKPIIGNYIKQHEAIYNIFYDAFNEFTQKSNNYNVSVKTNMLSQPEFDDSEKMRKIIKKLNDEDLIHTVEETKDGINIYIGDESNIDSDVTMIKTKYNINGEEGTIAIIGPKRMEYDKVVSYLDYVKKKIERE